MIIRSIDVETTGFPPNAAVIEFGWCDIVVEEGRIFEILPPNSMLVNPWRANPDLVMTSGAQATHLISREDLADAPSVDIGMRAIAGADIYLAHNAVFEQAFMSPQKPWICSLKLARHLYPSAASHKLQELRFALPVDIPDREYARAAHRAGPDAYVAAHLFKRMIDIDGLDVDRSILLSSGAMPMPTCPVGKHKGQRWADIPADYLSWLAFRSDMSPEIKRAARTELNARKFATAPRQQLSDDSRPF